MSEMGAQPLRRGHAAHPISELQIEYSLMSRGVEEDILPTLRELGIGVTAYGVLSRGILGGTGKGGLNARDFRAHSPRWQGENLQKDLAFADKLAAPAKDL